MHKHYYVNVFSIIYLCIIYFAYAISKWSKIFDYYIFLLFVAAPVAAVLGTVIVEVTGIYASL